MWAFASVFPPSTCAFATVLPPYTWHSSYVRLPSFSRLQCAFTNVIRTYTLSIVCVRLLPFSGLQRLRSLPLSRLIRDTVRMSVHSYFPAFNVIRFVSIFKSVFGLLRDPVYHVCVRFRFSAFNVCFRYRFAALYVTQFVCAFTLIFPPPTWSSLYVHSLPFSGIIRDTLRMFVHFHFPAFNVIRFICASTSVFRPSTWSGSYVRWHSF